MLIHLGGDVVVSREEVIAIFSMQLLKKSETNREFMNMAQDEGFVSLITQKDNVKSFIITTTRIFLSPISSMTLKKRCGNLFENIDNF